MAVSRTILKIDNIKTPTIETNNASLDNILATDISTDLLNATIVSAMDVRIGKISVKDSVENIDKKANLVDGKIDIHGNLLEDITLEDGNISTWLSSQKNALKSGAGFSINTIAADRIHLPFLKDFNISFNNITSDNFVFYATNTIGEFSTENSLFSGAINIDGDFYFEAPEAVLKDFNLFETTADSYINGDLYLTISDESGYDSIYINGSTINELLENNDNSFLSGDIILI